jgi:catechol 2,3-dioxygenase-like lactoylglutathione lyase family enzyme
MVQRKKAKRAARRPKKQGAGKAKGTGRSGIESEGLTFNHAMLYSADVERAAKFYRDGLGFRMIEETHHEGRMVYARMRSPGSDTTLGVHQMEPGQTMPLSRSMRLYFEVRDLEEFCKKLEASGIPLDHAPKLEAWGWKHAYLRDPDGHSLSLYWAGAKRLQSGDHRLL